MEVPEPPRTTFVPRPRRQSLATKGDVLASLGDPSTILVDFLSAELYEGGGGRHLWGQRPGHIPGAVNVPYLANIDPSLATVTAAEREELLARRRSFTFCDPDRLAGLYASAGVDRGSRVITYCGRGYAGSCGLLALRSIGFEDVRLYDGSWAEWSADRALPVETGRRSGPGSA